MYILKSKRVSNYLYLIVITNLFIACSNGDDEIIPGSNENIYKIENINFFLTEDDKVEYKIDRLDTITYVNYSNIQLSDTTFYPYKSLKDSLSIIVSSDIQEDITLKDSLAFRQMTIRPDNIIGYVSQDSTYISKFPSSFLLPLHNINEPVTFKPNPKTQYDITGEYWRATYTISFNADAINIENKNSIKFSGKLSYSRVKIGQLESQNESPTTIIVVASEAP